MKQTAAGGWQTARQAFLRTRQIAVEVEVGADALIPGNPRSCSVLAPVHITFDALLQYVTLISRLIIVHVFVKRRGHVAQALAWPDLFHHVSRYTAARDGSGPSVLLPAHIELGGGCSHIIALDVEGVHAAP